MALELWEGAPKLPYDILGPPERSVRQVSCHLALALTSPVSHFIYSLSPVFTCCFKIVFKMPISVNPFCGVLDRSGGLRIALVGC